MRVTSVQPNRKPLRLSHHDYSQAGPYFVTICTHKMSCLLGTVCDAHIILNPAGETAREVWYALPERFPRVVLDEFIIMPNHLHGILAFVGAGLAPPDAASMKSERPSLCSLPAIIGAFKSISTIKINRLLKRSGKSFWQRNYYEHIIRNGDDMKNAQRYILENPLKWSPESEHPESRNR
jgi:putative transposase